MRIPINTHTCMHKNKLQRRFNPNIEQASTKNLNIFTTVFKQRRRSRPCIALLLFHKCNNIILLIDSRPQSGFKNVRLLKTTKLTPQHTTESLSRRTISGYVPKLRIHPVVRASSDITVILKWTYNFFRVALCDILIYGFLILIQEHGFLCIYILLNELI